MSGKRLRRALMNISMLAHTALRESENHSTNISAMLEYLGLMKEEQITRGWWINFPVLGALSTRKPEKTCNLHPYVPGFPACPKMAKVL
jgi:hypothetical protein